MPYSIPSTSNVGTLMHSLLVTYHWLMACIALTFGELNAIARSTQRVVTGEITGGTGGQFGTFVDLSMLSSSPGYIDTGAR